MLQKLIKLPEVMAATSWSRPKIYAEMKEGNFPRPVRTGSQSVAWVASEIEAWVEARIAERDGKVEA
jgi:prophage regulatory protein